MDKAAYALMVGIMLLFIWGFMAFWEHRCVAHGGVVISYRDFVCLKKSDIQRLMDHP